MPCHHTDICLQLARSDTRLIQDAIRLTHTQITIIYGGEETNYLFQEWHSIGSGML